MRPEKNTVQSVETPEVSGMVPLLIGDGIHVLNHQIHKAIVMQDGEALAGFARKQLDAGAQALAVNLGPGREMGRLISWVADTIRELTAVPLFFSANIMTQKEVMETYGQNITINAVTANRDDLDRALAAAQKYGCSLAVLLVQSGKVTGGIEDRIQLAVEVLDRAVLSGLPLSRLYLDPVLRCRPDPAAWHVSRGLPDVGAVMETIALIKQLDNRVKTIVALGNGTEGMARESRGGFIARMLSLFSGAGLDAALLNCLDDKMMNVEERLLYRGVDSGKGQMCSAL